MSTLSDHLRYLHQSGEFTIDVSLAIFSPEEIENLRRFGHWYEALTLGLIEPVSEPQKEFIRSARGEKSPTTEHEIAWYKYLGRKKLESDDPDKFKLNYQAREKGFYTRQQFKQMRSMMGSEMNKNHRR
ncbi:DUF413 domain-containing protein [Algoriphagus sediminis]|uniref:Macrodomain Ori protein n=1 Tax=Algoriphagus sediminis TaxID=3057113 RepID=A0ABT7YB85_9BACT|nr:DUF413 domain-containing protein [Algoriphagus sediminis]MDN3203778.1 DUF413 domain-containing protein [Algoriphagus sediminis]